MPRKKNNSSRRRSGGGLFRGSFVSDRGRFGTDDLAKAYKKKHKLKQVLNTLDGCKKNLKQKQAKNLEIYFVPALTEIKKIAEQTILKGNEAQRQIDAITADEKLKKRLAAVGGGNKRSRRRRRRKNKKSRRKRRKNKKSRRRRRK